MLLDKICPENSFHRLKQANFSIFCVVEKNNTENSSFSSKLAICHFRAKNAIFCAFRAESPKPKILFKYFYISVLKSIPTELLHPPARTIKNTPA